MSGFSVVTAQNMSVNQLAITANLSENRIGCTTTSQLAALGACGAYSNWSAATSRDVCSCKSAKFRVAAEISARFSANAESRKMPTVRGKPCIAFSLIAMTAQWIMDLICVFENRLKISRR